MFRRLPPAPGYTVEQLTALAEQMREQEAGTGGWNQPDAQAPSGDNTDIPAAYTYFGQFVDHDITFDATSRLQVQNDPDALVSFRTPRYDLDSVYGSGPVDEPFQYDQAGDGRLLIGANGSGEPDLPRNAQGVALIGDPRNDENVIVSGLQIAMLRLHNKLLDQAASEGTIAAAERFDHVRTLVRWHYQWVVVHDYLPRICGHELGERLLDDDSDEPRYRLRFYRPVKNAYMPVEFSAAAFRFGHSQVRSAYDLNATIGVRPIFVPGDDAGEGADLRGGQPLLPGWSVDWPRFLPLAGSSPQPSRLIDAKLSPALFDLPRFAADEPQSLPLRNLLRGQALELPSGQDVAAAVGSPVLGAAELATDLVPTPLWYYLLKEAEVVAAGRTLGPTGARIVAEVLVGLLRLDPSSYLSQHPGWRPTLSGSSAPDGTFGLPDLVAAAQA